MRVDLGKPHTGKVNVEDVVSQPSKVKLKRHTKKTVNIITIPNVF